VSAVSDYGNDIEAYRFVKAGGVVDVLWSRSGNAVVAQVPLGVYRSAILWNGSAPSISQNASHMLITVGFQAVFINRAS
jgi:hypothetical protein